MIIRSSKGNSISGALRYVEGPGHGGQAPGRSKLIGGDGFGFEPNDETLDIAKRLMEQNGRREFQGEKDRYCEKDCYHFSFSWDPKQSPPDLEEKRETVRRALKALGMENSMRLVYDHNDKDHSHVHVIGSRVNPETGRAYDSYKDVQKSLQFSREKEREDEISGRRPIPEANRRLHDVQLDPGKDIEQNLEDRLEAIRKLYDAHKQEQDRRYRSKRAIDGLYKAHEQERAMSNDNDHWMKQLIDQWTKNREQAQEAPGKLQREKDRYWEEHGRWPSNTEEYVKHRAADRDRSTIDRIIDRSTEHQQNKSDIPERVPGGPGIIDRLMNSETLNKGRDLIDRAIGGEVKESEKTQEPPREPKLRFDDAIDKAIGANKSLKIERELER